MIGMSYGIFFFPRFCSIPHHYYYYEIKGIESRINTAVDDDAFLFFFGTGDELYLINFLRGIAVEGLKDCLAPSPPLLLYAHLSSIS